MGFLNFTFLFKAFNNFKESSRIIDGLEVSEPIPWIVQLLDFDNIQICGGVLLSNRHILSAAHCSVTTFSNYVVIGETIRSTWDDFQETEYLKHRTSQPLLHRRHEHFTSPEIYVAIFDLMLLNLETPLQKNCPQSFARLPNIDYADEDFMKNQLLILYGWGSTIAVTHEQIIASNKGELNLIKSFPLNLEQVSLAYVPNHVCQKRHQDFFNRHQKVRGRKKSGKYTGHTLRWLKFGEGLSMLCTSSCAAEDLGQCHHQHNSRTGCSGDSGCKSLRKISNADIVIFLLKIILY